LWRTTLNTTNVLSVIVALVAITLPTASSIGTVLLNSYFHSGGVSVGNRIGAEGAKALGDSLKDNATLISFSLDLERE
jgi:hypothetical protein